MISTRATLMLRVNVRANLFHSLVYCLEVRNVVQVRLDWVAQISVKHLSPTKKTVSINIHY